MESTPNFFRYSIQKWRQRKSVLRQEWEWFFRAVPFRFHDCGGKHNVSNAYVEKSQEE